MLPFLRTFRRNEAGFTLVEILLAMIILAAAGSMIMLAYTHSLVSTRLVDEQNIATSLARQQIEFLRQYATSPTLQNLADGSATPIVPATLPPGYQINSVKLAAETVTTTNRGTIWISEVPVQVTIYHNGRAIVKMKAYY